MRKDLGEKGQMAKLFDKYHKCIEEISETQELLLESKDDPDMKKMLEDDLLRLLGDNEEYGEIEHLQEEIVEVILPNSEAENLGSCTLEIMQAAGGSESSLFAEDILMMYKNYCRN